MKFSILGALLLVLIHCVTGINFNEHKFSVKEVSLYSEETWKAKFDTFIEKYGKKYDTDEEYNLRFNAYKANFIEAAKANDRQPYALFGENSHFDYTKEDWATLTGYSKPEISEEEIRRKARVYTDSQSIRKEPSKRKRSDIPTNFNWCDKPNICTPVGHQGSCGSCWAFTAAAAIESLWAIQKGQLYNLSKQFFVDCSKSLPNKGCKGGNPLMAFMDSRGIPYEEDYPYLESAGQCRTGFKTDVSLFGGYEALPYNTTFEELTENIYLNGPITFSACSNSEMHSYKSGILISTGDCKVTNHAMLHVGYGVEDGIQYMIIRNTWGRFWGENGYGKLKFGEFSSTTDSYYRPILVPDGWTCGENVKNKCDCDCGVYDPDCDDYYYSEYEGEQIYKTSCSSTEICSPVTAKCTEWSCDISKYNDGHDCDCNCGSWDPDCEQYDSYLDVIGCNSSDKEICSRVDGSCISNWTCGMKAYGVPGKCHCGCGDYDPGCLNCSSELIGCEVRPECKKDSGVMGIMNIFTFIFTLIIL